MLAGTYMAALEVKKRFEKKKKRKTRFTFNAIFLLQLFSDPENVKCDSEMDSDVFSFSNCEDVVSFGAWLQCLLCMLYSFFFFYQTKHRLTLCAVIFSSKACLIKATGRFGTTARGSDCCAVFGEYQQRMEVEQFSRHVGECGFNDQQFGSTCCGSFNCLLAARRATAVIG